jgi:class 3 adenylate cyclase/tetratricopeptide (TPR) repeat protein
MMDARGAEGETLLARDHRRLAAIVSADVVGYSLLMGRDESATLAVLKAHRRELIDPKITEYGGRIVKTTGDGLLLEFASVVDAVRCAVDVQRGMAERNASVPPEQRIEFRVGINVGDIIIDDDDIFGDGVNVAARLQTLAEPGGICVSRAVRDQVLDKLSFAFDDLGAQEVKNIVRPVEVYRVALASQAATPVVRDTAQHATRTGTRSSRRAWVLVSVAAIGLGVAAWTANRFVLSPAVIAPYSIEDRRMTFAVLPFQAPAGDAVGSQVATTMTDRAFASEETRPLWAQVASRKSVEQAVARRAAAKDLASDLNVHFLIRGNVTSAPSGYSVELLLVDGATERVIDTKTLAVGNGTLTPRLREELDGAMGFLTYKAVQVEAQRARGKPLEALDVRDLSFRAYVEWNEKKGERDEKGAYTTATNLLNRALTLAPDDPLALRLTAQVNLCDCVEGWSKNVEEQQAIGAAALEKYLRRDPESYSMRTLKGELYALHGRFEESLLIADSVLKKDPAWTDALALRAYDLLKLGKPVEALDSLNLVRDRRDWGWQEVALAASIYYALAQYDLAVQMAQTAKTQMRREELSNTRLGAVSLTLIAAEGRLGRLPRAKAALADFKAAVPDVDTISAMKQWMHPAADLAGYEPLFAGLRLAGVGD